MTFTVTISIRKNVDYSNAIKNQIIFALPGLYRVNQTELNSLDQGGSYTFEFLNEPPAANFAKKIFSVLNAKLDISTNFIVPR